MAYYLVEENVLRQHGIEPQEIDRSLHLLSVEDLMMEYAAYLDVDFKDVSVIWQEMSYDFRDFLIGYVHEAIEEIGIPWKTILEDAEYAYMEENI